MSKIALTKPREIGYTLKYPQLGLWAFDKRVEQPAFLRTGQTHGDVGTQSFGSTPAAVRSETTVGSETAGLPKRQAGFYLWYK